jgi:Flp pilus assembly protein TadB
MMFSVEQPDNVTGWYNLLCHQIMSNSSDNKLQKVIGQPLFWSWLFVFIWLAHVLATMIMQRWTGLAISLFGLLGGLLIAGAILSRRRKSLYPKPKKDLLKEQI